MAWAHFDDGIHGDPRIFEAGLAAAGLYLCVTTYCARYLTDGLIPKKAVGGMLENGDTAPLDALLRVGLLIDLGDEYEAPEYLIGNWTREKTEDERAKAAERQRKWRAKRERKKRGDDGGDVDA
jgi:hypothetical protein